MWTTLVEFGRRRLPTAKVTRSRSATNLKDLVARQEKAGHQRKRLGSVVFPRSSRAQLRCLGRLSAAPLG